jgi:hypothetical protein
MNDLATTAPPGKANPQAERELLISLLRTAAARMRLHTNTLDTIRVSLRHRQIGTDQAMAWLKEEGLLACVELGGKQ